MKIITILVMFVHYFCSICDSGSLPSKQQTEQNLITTLINGYNKNIRPDTQIFVQMRAIIQQIVTIDEKQQIMTSSFFISQGWIDSRLSWIPDVTNDNISVIMLPVKSIWIPDTMILNSADTNSYLPVTDYSYASIHYSGEVFMILPALTVKTRCMMNTQKFPFDKQMCSINLTSWSQGNNRIIYSDNGSYNLDTSEYVEHALWELERTDIVVMKAEDRAYFEETDSDVISIQLYLTRKPLFFLMNGIFACLILNCVTLISYLLPYATQISLSMVCFMTYSVYSLNFSNLFPQQSEYMMMITLYFLLSIGWTLISMGWFVLYNALLNRSDLPHSLDLFCRLLQEIRCSCCHKNNKQEPLSLPLEETISNGTNAIVVRSMKNDLDLKCNFCYRCSSCQADYEKNESKTKNKKNHESKCKLLNYFILACMTLFMLASNLAIWIPMSQ